MINMVKVITIRDDVYSSLFKIKRAKGMSFSEVLEYLVTQESEKKGKKTNMLALAGQCTQTEFDIRLLDKIKRGLG